MKKRLSMILALFVLAFALTGCGSTQAKVDETSGTIVFAAAASLKNVVDGEIIPAFNAEYPNIKVQPTYDASGKLQAQIEAGAAVDVFMSAATSNMEALKTKGLILDGSVANLLENKLVLIVPVDSKLGLASFTDVVKADKIAIGDPASVPAGKYAQEALTSLKVWDQVSGKLSLGTNVTEVLNWVAAGSAQAGFVYSTDALSNAKVKVVAEAPEGSVSKVLYPVGIVKASVQQDAASKFVKFLQTKTALDLFVKAGFTAAQ